MALPSYLSWALPKKDSPGSSPPSETYGTVTTKSLNLVVGKSHILHTPVPISRISVAEPAIADVLIISPKQIYINGKAPGITNVILWRAKEPTAILDVNVTYNLTQLKEKLYHMLPGEQIEAHAAKDSIVLSGEVSDSTKINRALSVAKSFSIKPENVVNLMQVGGAQQVMLAVKVAEMSRDVTKKMGFNFRVLNQRGEGLLLNIGDIASGGLLEGLNFTSNITARLLEGNNIFDFFLEALKENGLAKILAEPTLIAISGQDASFLAGGEFPVPVPQAGQAAGAITVEFKEFGVGLSFLPRVLENGTVNMRINTEVSDLDFTAALVTQGFAVPGLTTRRASTDIELKDGQTFAIAGLLQDNIREIVSKYPLLGDIPILGTLFRSEEFRKRQTELVILVTPYLVKPLTQEAQRLPTDKYVEPSDFDFYLMGRLEGKSEAEFPGKGPSEININNGPEEGLEGKFGHELE
jgi:pilus assembly protein CpaC